MPRLLLYSGILCILKIFIGLNLELGVDEAYYYTYAKKLQWSYFDHPLMVAVLQRISTLGLAYTEEWNLRFFPLLMGFLNPFVFYATARLIMSKGMASWMAIAYLCTIYGSIISGVFILPDAPLSFFGLWATYGSLQFIKTHQWKYLWLFSVAMALGLSSKYQMIFIGGALFLYFLKFEKSVFKNPKIYLSALISLLGLLPTIIWNAENHWINFQFHSSRVGEAHLFEFFFRELFGQVLYQNPIIFGLMVFTIYSIRKRKITLNHSYSYYALALSVPLIGVSLLLSIFTETLPHWAGIAYVGIFLWLGMALDKLPKCNPIKTIQLAYVLLLVILLFGYIEVRNGFIFNDLDLKQAKVEKGRKDPTLDVYGWQQLSEQFSANIEKVPEASKVIVSQRWYPAGQYDYYLARPNGSEVIVEGPMYESHEYAFKNNEEIIQNNNGNALFIAPSNHRFRPEHALSDSYEIQPLDSLPIYRRGDIVQYHFVYLLHKR